MLPHKNIILLFHGITYLVSQNLRKLVMEEKTYRVASMLYNNFN